MKSPLFFKAGSRLGLLNPPIGSKDLNIGVEEGPDSILDSQFLAKFKEFEILEFKFPKPEQIDIDVIYEVISDCYLDFSDLISQYNLSSFTPVVIGGDHSITFPSLNSQLSKIEDSNDLGYIQFDAHADMNLFQDSPTKNFHGMYLRPFLDDFDIPQINKIIFKKLNLQNIIFIGNLNLDPQEKEFFKAQKIKNFTKNDLKKIETLEKFKDFVNSFKYLYVSIDIDAFDVKLAPATGIPNLDGLSLEEVIPYFEVISKHPNLYLDLTEVNPQKDGADKTVKLAQQILTLILKGQSSA